MGMLQFRGAKKVSFRRPCILSNRPLLTSTRHRQPPLAAIAFIEIVRGINIGRIDVKRQVL